MTHAHKHANEHFNGDDDLQVATAGQPGIMSATQAGSLSGLEAGTKAIDGTTYTPVAANPGGGDTLWISSVDGKLYRGSTEVGSGGGGGGGGLLFTQITTSQTLVSNTGYIADSSGGEMILLLPAAPAINDEIVIGVSDEIGGVVVDSNGLKIGGTVGTFSITQSFGTRLVYTGATIGWVDVYDAKLGSSGNGYASGSGASVQTFVLASDSDSVSHGSLATSINSSSGTSSTISGFSQHGISGTKQTSIEKFNFSSNITAAPHGDLINAVTISTGCESNTHGYASGGVTATALINEYLFTSNVTASNHGNLTLSRGERPSGHSSVTQGFVCGGYNGGNYSTIDKFDFASSSSTAGHGSMSVAKRNLSGCESPTHGFIMGGYTGTTVSTIEKMLFSSNTTTANHGNLTVATYFGAGVSGNAQGFLCGGTSGGASSLIVRFEFASITAAAAHGNLTASYSDKVGHQG